MANTAINHDPVATFPGSSTNTAVVKWSGTSGNALLDSGVIIDGSNNVTGLNNVTATGYLHLTGDEKELRFYEGANYIAIAAPSGLGADYTFTLPLNDGAADEFLQTNGSGVLTWAAAAGTTINSNADNRVITGSGTANTLNGETGLVFTGTLLGINTATPDSGQYLHITGASGSVSGLTATTTSQLTVENNSNTAISILSPAADFGAVYFGDSNDNIAGGLIYNHGATRFDVRVEGSTKYILAPTLMTIPGGINFPDTQVASADVNTLDDYEEGTFTPTIFDDSLNAEAGGYIGSTSGRYVKIGNVVCFWLIVLLNGNGSLTTSQQCRVGGLPFASNSSNPINTYPVWAESVSIPSMSNVNCRHVSNVAYISMTVNDATTGTSDMTIAELTSNGQLYITGCYSV